MMRTKDRLTDCSSASATLGFLAQPTDNNQEKVVVKPAYYGVAGPAVFVPYPHKNPAISPPAFNENPQAADFDDEEIMLALFAVASLGS